MNCIAVLRHYIKTLRYSVLKDRTRTKARLVYSIHAREDGKHSRALLEKEIKGHYKVLTMNNIYS